MKLRYDKNNEWEIIAPNIIGLFSDLVHSETTKKYITLKQVSKILYSITQSIVAWDESNYKAFIGSLNENTASYFMTKLSSGKGTSYTVTRENITNMKNCLDYLMKLFSIILSSMVMDKKKKLFVE